MGQTTMVKIFFDTEFIENGVTIDLVSLGAVDDRGREFYAVSTEFNPVMASDWVKENVLDKLPPRHNRAWMSRLTMRDKWLAWCTEPWNTTPGERIEFWAYYGAYDHVAYAQLFGPMITLPKGMPMFTRELMQLWEDAGCPPKPDQPSNQHDALADARWNRELWKTCTQRIGPRLVGESGPELHLPTAGAVLPKPDTL